MLWRLLLKLMRSLAVVAAELKRTPFNFAHTAASGSHHYEFMCYGEAMACISLT